MKKLKLFSLALMALFATSVCGTDFNINLDDIRVLPTRSAFVKLSNGSNCTANSGKLQIANNYTGTFTIASNVPTTYKIKQIEITVNRNVTNFTCTDGGTLSGSDKSWTFTPTDNTPVGSASFSLNNKSGGGAQMTFVVTLTTTETITVEEIKTFSALSDDSYTFVSSAATSQIEITNPTGGNGNVNKNMIQFDKSGSKTYKLKVAAKTGYDLKFVSFYFYDCSSDPDITSSVTTYTSSAYTWIASSASSEVTFDADTKNAQNIKILKIYVGYAPKKYIVTIDPNGGAYAETPSGWTYDNDNDKYTKSVEAGSFTPPTGLTNGTQDLSWKDNNDNEVTFPTTITSSITFIAQWAPHSTSTDATLSDLKVGGETVAGFAPNVETYNVELPFETVEAPEVAGTANSIYAKSVEVAQAAAVPGVASIVVTAESDDTKTYTVNFSHKKDLLLVFKTGSTACPTAVTSTQILSNNPAVSTYINQITFTNVEGDGDNGVEGTSLNVGKKAGNMFTLTTKDGYAFKAMNFNAKIQDANCEFSLDRGNWTTLTSTNRGGDECYNNVFSNAEVKEFRLRSTGAEGVWIRNMLLTVISSEKETPTSINNTSVAPQAVKFFKDGQLFIEKNGHVYNVFGACVK